MKKKIMAMCLVIAMAATAVIGGTLAYFTDTDEATNTFTLGDVKIQLNEQQRIDKEKLYDEENLEDFEDQIQLLPLVDTNDKYHDPNYIDKIVTVTNTGKTPAYIRTIYAIPVADNYDEQDDQTNNWLHWNVYSASDDQDATDGWFWGTKTTGEYPDDVNDWNSIKDETKLHPETQKPLAKVVEIDGAKYMIYIATNVNIVEAEAETEIALRGLFLDPKVNKIFKEGEGDILTMINAKGETVELGNFNNFKIHVFAQAVQAGGFADAWEAFEKAGLPDNPWAK